MPQNQNELLALKNRIGEEILRKRLRQQVGISDPLFGEGRGRFHWENLLFVSKLLRATLKTLGLLERGLRNSLDFKVEEIVSQFTELPMAFDGYRILHLSDLHLDGMIDEGQTLNRIIHGLKYDLCVITGDFRFSKLAAYDETLKRMALLMENLICVDGCFGVLGNHDFIEMVPGFEKLDLRMLLNESVTIKRGTESIHLAGIDDPHFYGTHDIAACTAKLPSGAFSLLLAHSSEVIQEAAAAGFNLYLCGHSHGGQICLPGGIPLLTNSASSRHFSRGRWQHHNMQGYTSRGTGTSTLAVRYCCPPEITIHRLQKIDKES